MTILFSDVSGFTELTERLGDRESQRLLETYFQIVRGQVAAHRGLRGEVPRRRGDARVRRPDPGGALRRWTSSVRWSATTSGTTADPLRVHIGMHIGEVIEDRGDFLGRTVILASRITDAAMADEILVSSTLHGSIIEARRTSSSASSATVVLQGVSDTQHLYPVLWS